MAGRSTTRERQLLRIEAGQRVAAIREARKMQQKDLVAKAGIPGSTISNVESGARGMPADQRAKIAAALGVDPSVLDPAATPTFDLALALAGSASKGPAGMSGAGSSLPPELEAFLAKHPELPDQVRWHLVENRQFRLAPWKKQDEQFWGEMAEFWARYLRENPPAGGAKSRNAPGKG